MAAGNALGERGVAVLVARRGDEQDARRAADGPRERVAADVEVLARDLLALVGILADAALLQRVLVVVDRAAPAHVHHAHPVALEEVHVRLRVAGVEIDELARRAGIGGEVPVELDARHGEARVGVAGHRDAGDVRAVDVVAREADLLDRGLVLLGRQRRQELLHVRRLLAVDVRLQVREALQHGGHLRQPARELAGDGHAARCSRASRSGRSRSRRACRRPAAAGRRRASCPRRCPTPRSFTGA